MKKDIQSQINGCRTTRIYCRPGCPAGKRTRPENRIHFKSREEARASGYRACKICKPDAPAAETETFLIKRYNSPLGTYFLVSSEQGLVSVSTEKKIDARLARWKREGIQVKDGAGLNDVIASQLDAYFRGELHRFSVPLDLRGTPFQCQVWRQLLKIPYGKTCSYRDVARAIGRPGSARPVGQAVGSNPVSIIVPCHRVVGSDGSLTGYGGGLPRKRALLNLEGVTLPK